MLGCSFAPPLGTCLSCLLHALYNTLCSHSRRPALGPLRSLLAALGAAAGSQNCSFASFGSSDNHAQSLRPEMYGASTFHKTAGLRSRKNLEQQRMPLVFACALRSSTQERAQRRRGVFFFIRTSAKEGQSASRCLSLESLLESSLFRHCISGYCSDALAPLVG